MSREPVLSVAGVCKDFRGSRVLHDIHLEVAKGDVVALIGPSGCGKSTLLRCLTWLEQPNEGSIAIAGKPFGRTVEGAVVRRQSRRAIDAMRPRIGMVFQELNLWPHLTARENVVRPQTVVLKRARAEAEARADALLASLGLADKAGRFPYALSGGQKQRVAIARALAMDPTLMLFDEPTSALDPELIGDVLALLRDLAKTGMTMVVVTHEIGFATHVADRIVFMEAGRIVEEGLAARMMSAPSDPRVAAFLDLIQP